MLAIVWATKYFRSYLYGRRFKIQTDHRPLNWLMSLKEPNSKLVRWRLKLEEFNHDIEYKPGRINSNADALSRIQIELNITENNETDSMVNNPGERYNEILNDSDDTGATIHSADTDSEGFIPISERNLNYFKQQFVIRQIGSGSASIRTENFFENIRKTINIRDIDDNYIINLIKNYFNPKGMNAIYVENLQLFLKIQTIYREYFSMSKMKVIRCCKIVRDILLEEERVKTIRDYHRDNNHRGINETFEHIRQRYYFPRIREKITMFINNCKICQTEKYKSTIGIRKK